MVLPRHVYVHVPFCARRCAYCDFSIAVRRVVPVRRIRRVAAPGAGDLRFGGDDRWTVDTLYFGGGTPSRLGGDGRRVVLSTRSTARSISPRTPRSRSRPTPKTSRPTPCAPGATPGSTDCRSARNRSTIACSRGCIARTTRLPFGRAVDAARRGGIENLSLDLIFALPEDVERSWATDVARALELEPSHVSLYGLTIEPHTPLGRWQSARRGHRVDPTSDTKSSSCMPTTRSPPPGSSTTRSRTSAEPGRAVAPQLVVLDTARRTPASAHRRTSSTAPTAVERCRRTWSGCVGSPTGQGSDRGRAKS